MEATKQITVSILPKLFEHAGEIAKEENRTISELITEALTSYVNMRQLLEIRKYGQEMIKKQGLSEDDVDRLVYEHRHEK